MSHVRVPFRSNRSSKNVLVKQLVRHNLRSPLDDDPPNTCAACQSRP